MKRVSVFLNEKLECELSKEKLDFIKIPLSG